jgi:hypothetical protein
MASRLSLALLFVALACGGEGSGGQSGSGGALASGGVAAGGSAGTGGALTGGTDAGGFAGIAGSSEAGGLAGAGASGGSAGAGGAGGSAGAGGGAGAGGTPSVPLPGFGTIQGDCGPIDSTELLSSGPFVFHTNLDFASMVFNYAALSPGGKIVHDDGNLGGSSLHSEIFSYEVLYRCELAALLKTEGKIEYQPSATKKTDLLVQLDGYKIGVSVTRAFAFPAGSTYSVAQAQGLLEGKLADILISTQGVKPVDSWQKQILHVLAYNEQHRDALKQAYPNVPAKTKADTIVMVTVTDGDDGFIYQ